LRFAARAVGEALAYRYSSNINVNNSLTTWQVLIILLAWEIPPQLTALLFGLECIHPASREGTRKMNSFLGFLENSVIPSFVTRREHCDTEENNSAHRRQRTEISPLKDEEAEISLPN